MTFVYPLSSISVKISGNPSALRSLNRVIEFYDKLYYKGRINEGRMLTSKS